ncbi:SRPBCC family protein [Kitasatospora sp. NPDC004240]
MAIIKESVDIDVPVRLAYERIRRFEDFPYVLAGVDRVTRIDGRRHRWRVRSAGRRHDFVTEIVDLVPDRLITWLTVEGRSDHLGVFTFRPLGPWRTRADLTLAVYPAGVLGGLAGALGLLGLRCRRGLRRLKRALETLETPFAPDAPPVTATPVRPRGVRPGRWRPVPAESTGGYAWNSPSSPRSWPTRARGRPST